MLLFFLVFFGLQIFVLFCCAAAGNDAASQELSDQEQLQFIAEWKIPPQKKDVCCRPSFFIAKRIQTGYSHSSLLHIYEQNRVALLFI